MGASDKLTEPRSAHCILTSNKGSMQRPPVRSKRQAEDHICEVLLRARTGVRAKSWTWPQVADAKRSATGNCQVASCESHPRSSYRRKPPRRWCQSRKNGSRKPEKCESATGSLAIVASDHGPSHPCGVTPTDRDCQGCPEGVTACKPGTPPLDPRWTFPRATPMTRGCNPGGLNND